MLQLKCLAEGTQLRLARVAAGLTLHDVGMRANVSPPRLSEFERGRASLAADAVARVHAVLRPANRTQAERAGHGSA